MTNKEAVNWLINIAADIGKIQHQDLWHYEQALSEIREMIESEPDRKTGRWIYKPNVNGVVYCSECDFELHINDTNFCPNCGCRMTDEQSIDDKVADLPDEAYYDKNWKSKDGGGA